MTSAGLQNGKNKKLLRLNRYKNTIPDPGYRPGFFLTLYRTHI